MRKNESGSSSSLSLQFRLTSHCIRNASPTNQSIGPISLVCGSLDARVVFIFLKSLEQEPLPVNSSVYLHVINLFHSMRFQMTVIRAAKYRLAKNDVLQVARAYFKVLNFAKLYRKIFRSFVKIPGIRKLKRLLRGSSRYYLKIEDSFQHLHLSTMTHITFLLYCYSRSALTEFIISASGVSAPRSTSSVHARLLHCHEFPDGGGDRRRALSISLSFS